MGMMQNTLELANNDDYENYKLSSSYLKSDGMHWELLDYAINEFEGIDSYSKYLEELEKEDFTDIAKYVEDIRKENHWDTPPQISVKNVSFKYAKDEANIIRNFSMEFEPGKTYSILGASGSGKTTLFNIVAGLITPTEGSIYYDRVHSTEIDYSQFLRKVGYVTQTSQLFMTSILENMFLGNHSLLRRLSEKISPLPASTKRRYTRFVILELLSALKQSSSLKFVEELPEGVLTRLGDKGVGLSGGQIKRIVLARMFFKKPALVFLDEATSALDSATEQNIIDELDTFLKGKTCFLITHRPQSFDRLLHEEIVLKTHNLGVV